MSTNTTQPKPVYVSMTDRAMSGWGRAEGRINKLVFICKDYKEAEIVEQNAINRGDMTYINICNNKPYYNKDRYYAQMIDNEIYSSWYKPNYFKANRG